MTDQIIELDSLVANEFTVEIDGQALTGIFGVQGFVPYQLHAPTEPRVTITKMVQRDAHNVFNKWLRDAETNGRNATRELAIVAVDDGVETRRWTLKGAYIVSVGYSDFDSASTEMVEERVTIGYSEVEHRWSASGV